MLKLPLLMTAQELFAADAAESFTHNDVTLQCTFFPPVMSHSPLVCTFDERRTNVGTPAHQETPQAVTEADKPDSAEALAVAESLPQVCVRRAVHDQLPVVTVPQAH
jgi:hypothetical protein